MSCEKNTSTVADKAGTGAGIATTVSKSGYTAGAMLLSRAREMAASGQATFQKTRATLHSADEAMARRAAMAAYLMGLTGPAPQRGVLFRANRKILKAAAYPALKIALLRNPAAAVALRRARAAQIVGHVAASVAAALSKTGDAGQVFREKRVLFFFKTNKPVALWKSGLTNALNRRDVIGSPQNVISSDGVMFKPGKGNPTWHRGTTVVKTAGGERTVTHLQSLSLPGTHYYFNQAVSDEHSVGLATGKIKPEAAPGYVGQVRPVDMLCAGWASTKHALLKASLQYGPGT